MLKIFLGIDPGMSGACAILYHPQRVIKGLIFDFEEMRIIHHLQEIAKHYHHDFEDYDVLAAIEKITVNKGTPSKIRGAMTKVMANMERWAGRFEALEIPHIFVTPGKWQKLVFNSMTKRDRKEMSLDLARRLFPWAELHLKKHHHRADALLIAEYLRRIDK